MVTLLVNGAIAARIDSAGELDTAITFVVEGRMAQMYAIRNPEKLGGWKRWRSAAVTALWLRPEDLRPTLGGIECRRLRWWRVSRRRRERLRS